MNNKTDKNVKIAVRRCIEARDELDRLERESRDQALISEAVDAFQLAQLALGIAMDNAGVKP